MSHSPIRPELFEAAQAFLIDYLNYDSSESMVITTDTAGDQAVVRSIVAAAIAAGGRPLVITLPQLPYQGKLADPYLPASLAGAVGDCDLWVDVTFPYIAGSELHAAVMAKESVRYMLASDMSAGAMQRLFGAKVIDRFYDAQEALDDLFAASAGKTVRITTPLGTDVSFQLAKPHGMRPRRANVPGLFTIPGSCSMTPELESVKGRIVVETVFHEFYTPLRAPIELELDGRIQKVSGGGTENAMLQRALRRAGGGDFGYVIHFTHGLHPSARLTGTCFIEDMRVPGSDAVGLGLPWWVPGGGENHPDAVMTMQSIWIDGKQIIDESRILEDTVGMAGAISETAGEGGESA